MQWSLSEVVIHQIWWLELGMGLQVSYSRIIRLCNSFLISVTARGMEWVLWHKSSNMGDEVALYANVMVLDRGDNQNDI